MAGSSNLTFKPVKFLCSYGGRILPRYPDGKLRYHGGENRVLSVDISISFAELVVKMGEMCGSSVTVNLRCQLPTQDLDALVSITSDEDLAHLIQEYDCATSAAAAPKMRVFLSAPKAIKRVSPHLSSASVCSNDVSPPLCSGLPPRCPKRRSSRPPSYPIVSPKSARKIPNQFAYQFYNGCGVSHLIHNGSICQ